MSQSTRTTRSLAEERAILIRRSALLREQIANHSRQLTPKVRAADGFVNAVGWVKANPGIVLGVVGSLLVLRPRRTIKFGLRAWGLWRLSAKVMPFVRLINRLR